MEWIWVVFIIFAIISNLAEKQGKQKRSKPRPPFPQSRPDRSPVPPQTNPLPEWARDFSDFFGLEQEGAPQGGKDLGSQEKGLAEQKDIFSGPGSASDSSVYNLAELKKKKGKAAKDLVLEDGTDLNLEDDMFLNAQGGIEGQDEDLEEFPFSENAWAGDERAFQAALLLAQALPRPDLKTFPWQRKI